jgi:hypothetical protein
MLYGVLFLFRRPGAAIGSAVQATIFCYDLFWTGGVLLIIPDITIFLLEWNHHHHYHYHYLVALRVCSEDFVPSYCLPSYPCST